MPQPDWEELERRIARLEKMMGVETAGAVPMPSPADGTEAPPAVNFPAMLPVLGRALLGLAGAYLLRAVGESSASLAAPGVAGGIVYAGIWLIWAARTAMASPLEAAVRSLTAVLVLCPLLWEATIYLHVLSTWTAAALLAAFACFGLGVSWRKNLRAVATVAVLAGLATAAGMLVATRDVMPFVLVFLALAAAVEASACLEHFLGERWLVALAADLAVLLATWLVTREHGLPESYAPIPAGWLLGAQAALLAIYLASVLVRTLARGLAFTWFEMAQCGLAFVLAAGGGLLISGQEQAIGAFLLVCGAACYLAAFRGAAAATRRNAYIYSTFGIVLVLAGCRMVWPGAAAPAVWCGLAVTLLWAGAHWQIAYLQVHGGVYLLLGLAVSGVVGAAGALILASDHGPGGSVPEVWIGLAVAAFCWRPAMRSGRAIRLLVCGATIWLLAGVLEGAAAAVYHALFAAAAADGYCSTLRTAVPAGIAAALALGGGRWKMADVAGFAIPVLVLGAYRLMAIDVARDPKPALFLLLAVYGGVLVALPRLMRARAGAEGALR